ncbi:MAG TPA: type II toxin-antitoxin system VapC family toxin [Candidatus Nanoarchaeia archaeon]|nr:type II toxin-antitoxin system VapC family toxin [Candidatus Nanoarchaeia archaeon]
MILIDTNIFVDHLRGYAPAVKFFESLASKENILFSVITEAELIACQECKEKAKKEGMLQFLSQWNKIIVTNQIAVLAGDLSRDKGIDLPDALIAATALVNKAELVTKNIKDFKKITELSLRVPY